MKYKGTLTALLIFVAAALLGCEALYAIKELVLASIPTTLIVVGCALCLLFAAAVVLAAIKGITQTLTT